MATSNEKMQPPRSPEGEKVTNSAMLSWSPMVLWLLTALVLLCLLSAFFVPAWAGWLRAHMMGVFAVLAVVLAVAALAMAIVGRDIRAMASLTRAVRLAARETDTDPALIPGDGALATNLRVLLSALRETGAEALDTLAANRVLRREHEQLFQLLASIRVGLIITDPGGTVLFANPPSQPWLNKPIKKIHGEAARKVISEPGILNLLDEDQEEIGRAGTQRLELSPDAERGTVDVAVSCTSALDANGQEVGKVVLIEDISQEKTLQKLRTDFIDSVAHELRTPLSTMQTYAESLAEGDIEDPDMVREFCNIIFQESHRLTDLIDSFLDISMLQSGAAHLSTSPTRLRKVIEDATEIVREIARERKIELQADLPDRLPVLDVDKRLFTMAVVNILGNAVKYTPESGTVAVSTDFEEEYISLNVTDTGVGISEDDLPRIFDKFFRAATAEVAEVTGSGIGLSTAQQIIQHHGGEIRVTSQLGEGSRFSIVLPRELINQSLGD